MAVGIERWRSCGPGLCVAIMGCWLMHSCVWAQQSPANPPRRQTEVKPPSRKPAGSQRGAVSGPSHDQSTGVPSAGPDPAPRAAGAIPLPLAEVSDPDALLPPPYQLSPAEQQRVDQILALWEKENKRIHTFRCQFKRHDFDPVFGPENENLAKTISEGEIRYSAPDRGLFEIDGKNIREFSRIGPEGKAEYISAEREFGEKWICDGESVFEFVAEQKILRQMKLPPDMRGKAIADGPLPFLFGASADQLRSRYFVKELDPPETIKNEYWLEARPRKVADAADFQIVRIAMDIKFQPKAMEIVGHANPNNRQFARQIYQFREIRINSPLDNLKELAGKKLIDSRTPAGWQKVVEDFGGPSGPPARTAQDPPAGPRVGQRVADPAAKSDAPRRK